MSIYGQDAMDIGIDETVYNKKKKDKGRRSRGDIIPRIGEKSNTPDYVKLADDSKPRDLAKEYETMPSANTNETPLMEFPESSDSKMGGTAEQNAMAAQQMSGAISSEGGSISKLGGVTTAAGMIPGPQQPYVLAAGGGLSTIGAIVDRKRKRRDEEVRQKNAAKLHAITLAQNGLATMARTFEGAV